MDIDEMMSTSYLQELYNTTQGNPDTQASMYDIGQALGLEKPDAGRIAEELMVMGYIELKTLAGSISITNEGLGLLGIAPPAINDQESKPKLSSGPVVNDADRQVIDKIISSIKTELARQAQDYTTTEQTVLDLKTIELHLLSPAPKTAVVLELFRSLEQSFKSNEAILNNSGLAAVIE